MSDFAFESSDDPEDLFTLLQKVGEGYDGLLLIGVLIVDFKNDFRSYGAVYKALHKSSGSIVAAKLVPIDDDLEEIFKEINVIKACNSPFIVKFLGNLRKDNHLWVG